MADLPFSKMEFYDQFHKGGTMLYLKFVRRVEPLSVPKRCVGTIENGGYLEMHDLLGIYEGTADSRVIIGIGNERIMVPMDTIRCLKEFKAGELFEILHDLSEAIDLMAVPKAAEAHHRAIMVVNALRRMNDRYPILVPRHKQD